MNNVTRNPISRHRVAGLEHAPCLIEGSGEHALEIHHESQANPAEYHSIRTHGSLNSSGLNRMDVDLADNLNTVNIKGGRP